MSLIYRVAFSLSLTSLPLLITYCLKLRHKKLMEKIKSHQENNYYYHCLYFRPKEECREHVIKDTVCGKDCVNEVLMKLRRFISSAKTSISLCMYHYTLREVTDDLIRAHNRGVSIRIIGDEITSNIFHSQINFLEKKYGVPTKIPNVSNLLMHHKFGVIDHEDPQLSKVFIGSLNLTTQGICKNYEFVVMTNNKSMITHFSDEFELLWDKFKLGSAE